jgi:hypothetical protein
MVIAVLRDLPISADRDRDHRARPSIVALARREARAVPPRAVADRRAGVW